MPPEPAVALARTCTKPLTRDHTTSSTRLLLTGPAELKFVLDRSLMCSGDARGYFVGVYRRDQEKAANLRSDLDSTPGKQTEDFGALFDPARKLLS